MEVDQGAPNLRRELELTGGAHGALAADVEATRRHLQIGRLHQQPPVGLLRALRLLAAGHEPPHQRNGEADDQ